MIQVPAATHGSGGQSPLIVHGILQVAVSIPVNQQGGSQAPVTQQGVHAPVTQQGFGVSGQVLGSFAQHGFGQVPSSQQDFGQVFVTQQPVLVGGGEQKDG